MASFRSALVVLLSASGVVFGQNPAGWRGDGTGVYPAKTPPVKWSKTQNVRWTAKMPGRSNALPVIVGDRVFVCAEPFELICLRASDGKQIWSRSNSYRDVTDPKQWAEVETELAVADPLRRQLQEARQQLSILEKKDESDAVIQQISNLQRQIEEIEQRLEGLPLAARYTLPITQRQYNGYTTATPTSDGKFIWAVFGNRVVVCYDLDGQLQWSDVLPDSPHAMWGHSSSPLLVDDKLVVSIDRIVCYDARSGRQMWVTKYGQTWGSPTRARVGDEQIVLMANGRILRASDGKVIKRVPGLPNASPFVIDEVAYFIDLRSEAYRLPGEIGDTFTPQQLWSTDLKGGDFFASAVMHNGLLYAVSTRHILNVVDASNGEVVYQKRLSLGSGPVWASLCAAGDYLYISSRDGTTLVLKLGRQYQEVAKNHLEYFISTPVFHGARMYVRTNEHLYCIEQTAPVEPGS